MTIPVASAGEAGSAIIKNQIITLVTSSVGANILTSCPIGSLQLSLLSFSAGSITHVLTEIAAGKAIKEVQEKNVEEIKALQEQLKHGGAVQRTIIAKNLSDEEEKLKFVSKRIGWLGVVSSMYIAATALAGLEAMWELPPFLKTSVAGCHGLGYATSALTYKGIVAAFTFQNFKAAGGGVVGLIQSLGFLLLPVHAGLVPFMYQNSYARIATFGAASLFTNSVIEDLKGIKTKLEGNVAKLRMVLNQFDQETQGDGGMQETAGAASGAGLANNQSGNNRTYALKALPTVSSSARQCLSNINGMTISAQNCSSPYKLSRPKFDINMDLPTLKNFTNQATDMTNALAEGDMARADVLAGALQSQAGRINNIKTDILKQLNDKLKAQGKKPTDFDGEIKKRYASMSGDFDKAVAASAGSLASLKAAEAALGDDVKANNIIEPPKVAEPVAISDIGFKENTMIEEPVSEATQEKIASLDESLNEYETIENDISKDPEISIFKQVSNRYFLNYTKIFQRKEINPPLTGPDPNP